MKLTFPSLAAFAGDRARGRPVEIDGWLYPFGADAAAAYLALVDAPPCCFGCLPREPERRIEVFAAAPIPIAAGPVRLAGRLHTLDGDPSGWRYQLRDARVVAGLTRRRVLAAAAMLCVAAAAPAAPRDAAAQDARAVLAGTATVDIHSHAGGAIGVARVRGRAPFAPLAAPMKEGGMAVVCLAAVADQPAIHVTADRRIQAFREPEPGELYAYSALSFQRIADLAREQGLRIVAGAADLAGARSERPSIVVASEGADFLEGELSRLDEAVERWGLRHLQLTHYRVNALGDIQTEARVHGGLTPFGAEVIRRCNRIGVVVDIAHGTIELVRRAAAVTTRPLVLSHTSLSRAPGPRSRLISPDHARLVAGTGGVIGIWPPASIFPDIAALAAGMARMVDAVGVDHVALGSDLGGLVGASAFASYRDLPALAAALLARGFHADEVRKLLGGNYARVFAQTMS